MEVMVRGQNLEVTEALANYLRTKLHKLDRYPGRMGPAQARMVLDGEAHVVEVTVPVDGRILRAEAESTNMYASVDQVTDRLLHQLQKYRQRLSHHGRNTARSAVREEGEQNSTDTKEFSEEKYAGDVVRVKRFSDKPMTVEEAVLRIELLGHDFFAFRDAQSGEVCVLYRRKSGGYGLLVPEE